MTGTPAWSAEAILLARFVSDVGIRGHHGHSAPSPQGSMVDTL